MNITFTTFKGQNQDESPNQHQPLNSSGTYGAFDTSSSLHHPSVNNNEPSSGSSNPPSSQFSSSNFPVMSKIFSHPTDTVTSTDLTRLGK